VGQSKLGNDIVAALPLIGPRYLFGEDNALVPDTGNCLLPLTPASPAGLGQVFRKDDPLVDHLGPVRLYTRYTR